MVRSLASCLVSLMLHDFAAEDAELRAICPLSALHYPQEFESHAGERHATDAARWTTRHLSVPFHGQTRQTRSGVPRVAVVTAAEGHFSDVDVYIEGAIYSACNFCNTTLNGTLLQKQWLEQHCGPRGTSQSTTAGYRDFAAIMPREIRVAFDPTCSVHKSSTHLWHLSVSQLGPWSFMIQWGRMNIVLYPQGLSKDILRVAHVL
ncbi:hypothetical protein B0H15DRAFT_157110 [Mycena belliarum]|uniref:Uncharacterized protein n=1 Tax=Mycena belliarum TaxID=1033014 RepID=A0AAD6UC54_9AGAR|nr:hypothetical protein B0H15DRAFT_157110 [Mycena belliae]